MAAVKVEEDEGSVWNWPNLAASSPLPSASDATSYGAGAGGVQPGGLSLWSQVVLSAAVNRSRIETLLLCSSGCLLHPDTCVLSSLDHGLDVIFICLGKVVFLIVCQVSWCGSPGSFILENMSLPFGCQ